MLKNGIFPICSISSCFNLLILEKGWHKDVLKTKYEHFTLSEFQYGVVLVPL